MIIDDDIRMLIAHLTGAAKKELASAADAEKHEGSIGDAAFRRGKAVAYEDAAITLAMRLLPKDPLPFRVSPPLSVEGAQR